MRYLSLIVSLLLVSCATANRPAEAVKKVEDIVDLEYDPRDQKKTILLKSQFKELQKKYADLEKENKDLIRKHDNLINSLKRIIKEN